MGLAAPDVTYAEGLLPSQTDPEFAAYCRNFLHVAKAETHCSVPEDIQVAVPDLGGRSIFLTAFVVPLPPPPGFDESETAMLRLVSMIPYIEDWVAFEGGYDVGAPRRSSSICVRGMPTSTPCSCVTTSSIASNARPSPR